MLLAGWPAGRLLADEISARATVAPAALADEQQVGSWSGTTFSWQPVQVAVDRQAVLRVTIPAGHRYFTAVIDDALGKRVRNLLSMEAVEKFGGDPNANGPQQVSFRWNGCDDNGQPVPAGEYRLRGLSHPGLKIHFDYSWYNPGTPPWEGSPTSGWGADHACLGAIACAPVGNSNPWQVVLSGPGGESGHAVWALDKTGRKVWGFKRHWSGANAVAIADDELWLAMAEPKVLTKLRLGTGEVHGFQRPAGVIGEIKFDADLRGVAVGKTLAAVLLGDAEIALLDRAGGRERARAKLPARTIAVAVDPRGGFVVSAADGLRRVAADGSVAALELPGLKQPGGLAVDTLGQLYVIDLGPDQQVKIYSPTGTLVRAIGFQGGQQGLAINRLALRDPVAIAVDAEQRVWIVEPSHPRRVSVWSPTGELVREFIGNTQYGAAHMTMHEQDPMRGLLFNTQFRLDPAKLADYRPERFLSSGLAANSPLRADSPPYFFHRPTFFRSAASGKPREYLIEMQPSFPVLYVEKQGDYRPVMAIVPAASYPAFTIPGLEKQGVTLWCDFNEDERVQAEELQLLGTEPLPITAFYAWTLPISPSLELTIQGKTLRPTRYLESGAPIYDVKQAAELPTNESLIRVGNHRVGVRSDGVYAVGRYLFVDERGQKRATYPGNWMGLHASTQSPVPRAGQTCGELFWAGTADVGGELGSVAVSHGNYGQAFVFSEDGLFVSSLFKDVRQKNTGLGDRFEKGLDWTDATMGQEAFGGWFGKQDDGHVRYLWGRNAALVCQVTGWDDVRRFETTTFRLKENGAITEIATEKLPSATPTALAQRDADRKVVIDGQLSEWQGVQRRTIRSGDEIVGQVSLLYDDDALYVAGRVVDGSPPRNAAEDFRFAFKSGAAIDLYFGPAQPDRNQAITGDFRVLLVPGNPKPYAVLFRPVCAEAKAEERVRYRSPVRELTFDQVKLIDAAELAFRPAADGYMCEVRLPLRSLDLKLQGGTELRCDLGILSANPAGELTTRRSYLFGQTNTIIADIPSEAELQPELWGLWRPAAAGSK